MKNSWKICGKPVENLWKILRNIETFFVNQWKTLKESVEKSQITFEELVKSLNEKLEKNLWKILGKSRFLNVFQRFFEH